MIQWAVGVLLQIRYFLYYFYRVLTWDTVKEEFENRVETLWVQSYIFTLG